MNASLAATTNLNLLLDVPVEITVQLGSCELPMREVLGLNVGSIVQLDQVADAPVELHVNQKLVARGDVVVVENRFGIKITELFSSAS
jgi:flagellar motor switch protein FliN/FliY